jgi:hypothetical protein
VKRLVVVKFSVHGRNKEVVKTYMGEVQRSTYYKPAEVIRDRKVVVVPKVEGKIFTYTLNSKNFFLKRYYT